MWLARESLNWMKVVVEHYPWGICVAKWNLGYDRQKERHVWAIHSNISGARHPKKHLVNLKSTSHTSLVFPNLHTFSRSFNVVNRNQHSNQPGKIGGPLESSFFPAIPQGDHGIGGAGWPPWWIHEGNLQVLDVQHLLGGSSSTRASCPGTKSLKLTGHALDVGKVSQLSQFEVNDNEHLIAGGLTMLSPRSASGFWTATGVSSYLRSRVYNVYVSTTNFTQRYASDQLYSPLLN